MRYISPAPRPRPPSSHSVCIVFSLPPRLLSHSPRAPQGGETIVLPARAARPRGPCAGLLRTTEQESCQPSRARGCSRHARCLRATGGARQSHGPSYSPLRARECHIALPLYLLYKPRQNIVYLSAELISEDAMDITTGRSTLGACPRISAINSLNPRLACRAHPQMGRYS